MQHQWEEEGFRVASVKYSRMRPWATTAVNMPWLSDDHVRTRKRGGERGESKCVLAQSFVFFTETVRHLFLWSVPITREVVKSPRG